MLLVNDRTVRLFFILGFLPAQRNICFRFILILKLLIKTQVFVFLRSFGIMIITVCKAEQGIEAVAS